MDSLTLVIAAGPPAAASANRVHGLPRDSNFTREAASGPRRVALGAALRAPLAAASAKWVHGQSRDSSLTPKPFRGHVRALVNG
jgi:hypothetical protein